MSRWAWAEIDLDAFAHNVHVLRRAAAPADLWAVVKADGYGHGAARVAAAALDAGATGLCVALVEEGVELRTRGVEAPILVLTQQALEDLPALLAARLTPTVYTPEYVRALAAAAASTGAGRVGVHLKVDTGMQRVGVRPERVGEVVDAVDAHAAALRLDGIFTHLAMADEPAASANADQLEAFDRVLAELGDRCPPVVHAANSAATIALPAARRSIVRAGIALYGISPGPGVDDLAAVAELRPVLSLRARVAHVKEVPAGSHVSYGWRHRFDRDTVVATVPIGYADGVPRRLGTVPGASGADVLVRGRRCPIVGVVTMDQIVVDVGPGAAVDVGDEVVLIGRQGDERIRAEDWAERLGTIGYEIVCGIGARVPRVVPGAAPAP